MVLNTQIESKSESNDKLILADIYDENINIAIWKRNINKELSQSVQNYITKNTSPSTLSIIVTPADTDQILTNELPEFIGKEDLISDIANLVDIFCCLFELKQAGLRLAVINKAMCPRFHVDHVPCRLVTCYSSVATEWLDNQHVDRALLGKTDNPFTGKANIQRLNVGDIALLKGESWIGNSGRGLVHRSPEIISGESRLLLTLDFA